MADASTGLQITPLGDGDRAAWERLFTGYNTFYGRELSPELMQRAWAELRAGTRIHALGARLDGRLIAITHFLPHANTTGEDVCYLQDLFTDPGSRGHGAGRGLIAAVTDWARAHGCGRVYWSTHESNATARRLYDQVADYRGFIRYQIDL